MASPAAYPANDAAEVDAITTLRTLVDSKVVKLHLSERDKVPNTDGIAELVRRVNDLEIPIGKFEVQVKKIPVGQTYYDFPTSLVAYSQVSTLPVVLICVDVDNKVAYWRQCTRSMSEYQPDQQTFRIHFDPSVEKVGPSSIVQWQTMIADYQSRIEEHPKLKEKFQKELGLQGIERADVHWFQQYVDTINTFLDRDYPAIKELFFTAIWKLGVAILDANKARVEYLIYCIPAGQNAPLVCNLKGESPDKLFTFPDTSLTTQSAKPSTHIWSTRACRNAPEHEGAKFVLEKVVQAAKKHRFAPFGTIQCTEYIWWLVENYPHALGLQPAQSYSTEEINSGMKIFLPNWYELAVTRYYKRYSSVTVPTVIPTFENVAGMRPESDRPTKEETLKRSVTGQPISKIAIATGIVSVRTAFESLERLVTEGVKTVSPPYRPRTLPFNWIWEGFTAVDMKHNVNTVLSNVLEEYRSFIVGNHLQAVDSFYLNPDLALIFVADVDSWIGPNKHPHFEEFIVENKDRKLPATTILDSATRIQKGAVRTSIVVDGLSRNWVFHAAGRDVSELVHRFPMQTIVYRMLKEDLGRKYKTLRVPGL